MSTAIGHGLVDPKRRGKPVSNANKDRTCFLSLSGAFYGGELFHPLLFPLFFLFFSLAREGRRGREGEKGGGSFLGACESVEGSQKSTKKMRHHTSKAESKGNPVNIPEPEGWTEGCL